MENSASSRGLKIVFFSDKSSDFIRAVAWSVFFLYVKELDRLPAGNYHENISNLIETRARGIYCISEAAALSNSIADQEHIKKTFSLLI